MLFNFEKNLLNQVNIHKKIFLFIIITLLILWIRIAGLKFHSIDMDDFLLPWYHQIKSLGFSGALRTQVGDYNFLYQLSTLYHLINSA